MSKSRDFQQKYGPWALVTGASSGIGREFALQLAARGVNVVLVARRAAELESLGASLRKKHGTDYRVAPIDLTANNALEQLQARCADLDIGLVVCNAGFGSAGPLTKADLATELRMIDLNCRSLFALTRVFAEKLVARGNGGIVLLGSILGFQGTPMMANYAATKAYVISLGEAFAHEMRHTPIRVLTLAPGPTETEFAQQAGMQFGTAMAAADVVRIALGNLDRGGLLLPGWLPRLLHYSLAFLPRGLRVRIMGGVMHGMIPTESAMVPR